MNVILAYKYMEEKTGESPEKERKKKERHRKEKEREREREGKLGAMTF